MLSRTSKISVAASEDEPVVPQFEIGGLLLPQVEPIAYGRKPDMRARRRRRNRVPKHRNRRSGCRGDRHQGTFVSLIAKDEVIEWTGANSLSMVVAPLSASFGTVPRMRSRAGELAIWAMVSSCV